MKREIEDKRCVVVGRVSTDQKQEMQVSLRAQLGVGNWYLLSELFMLRSLLGLTVTTTAFFLVLFIFLRWKIDQRWIRWREDESWVFCWEKEMQRDFE